MRTLDFLQQVTDCHFGGAGFLAFNGDPAHADGIEWSIIDVAGGTPALIFPDSYLALAPALQFTGSPLTQADINRQYKLLAGHPITGLAATSFDTGTIVMWIGLKGFPSHFTVRVLNKSAFDSSYGVFLYKSSKIKAGYDLQSPGWLSPDTAGQFFPVSAGKSVDVKVDTLGFKVSP